MKKIALLIGLLIASKTPSAQIVDTVKFAAWINEHAIELDETNNAGFESLANKLNDKSIIGLGESVHGSKTINNLRINIAKALIENGNFENVAFEMSFNTGLRLNHFLHTGDGDVKQILGQSHYFLNSNELLDFILWMRNYNKQSEKKLSLYGFDIQSNIDLVEDLSLFYTSIDPDIARLTRTLVEIFATHRMGSFGKYTTALKDSVLAIVEAVKEKHQVNRKKYIIASDFVKYEYAGKRIEVLSNYLNMLNSGYSQSMRIRDFSNAEIVTWIKNFEGENSKIILFAHDGHLGVWDYFTPRVRTLSIQGFYEDFPKELITGYYLKKTFGDDYYFISIQFGRGSFMGFDPDNDFKLSKLDVIPPEAYSLPHILSTAESSSYFIDFVFPKNTPRQVINYICSLQSFYHIGAAYDYKYAKARLISYFDAVIYVHDIEPSDLLHLNQ